MKNILVAGAGKGIGLSVARLLSAGNRVLAITRSKSQELEHTGADVHYGDCTQQNGLDGLTLPDVLDGLVYCPGSIHLKPFARLTAGDFLLDFEQNVLGAVRLLQQCLPALKQSANPGVVLYSTVAVKTGMAFHSSIAASKAAVEGLTRSLAAEFAGSRIRFNAIALSLIETPLSSFLVNTTEKKEAAAKRHPLQRIGNAGEAAALTAFLLSDDAGWMTGQVIGLDGGLGTLK